MITRALMMRLFDGFTITRWNDKIRPFPLIEIDKQTHKMIYAYFFGVILEHYEKEVKWDILIDCFVYEYIQRLTLTDLKSPFFHYIENNDDVYKELNKWIVENFKPFIEGSHEAQKFIDNMLSYLNGNDRKYAKYKYLLKLSNTLSTIWEFNLIYGSNRNGYKIKKIHDILKYDEIKYFNRASNEWKLDTEKGLYAIYDIYNINKLIHLIVELRYQIRWSHLPMYPKTTVLGHMGYVALLTYFLTREITIHNDFLLSSKLYKNRIYNNFFTALFHDIKEVGTRDIISPVKSKLKNLCTDSEKVDIVTEYENHEYSKIKNLICGEENNDEGVVNRGTRAPSLTNLLKLIDDEFSDKVNGEKEDNLSAVYKNAHDDNNKEISPRDGKLVKVADLLAACIEAKSSLLYGINNPTLSNNYNNILNLYNGSKDEYESEMYKYNIYALFKQLV